MYNNTTDPNQSPNNWSPQPPNGQYQQQRPNNPNQSGVQQPQPQQGAPAMPTLQPQHPDQYRALPPPQQIYPPPYGAGMAYPPTQPAPRQRTAIACRYCRRRKIRCSGFDQSDDGRCTNCQRFSQECVFTPVSSQTQAFVPAHTVWRGQGGPPPNTQLYGAYGQPLPQHGQNRDGYPQQQQQQQQQAGQYPPVPPQGYQQQPMYGQQPGQQMPAQGTKRPNDEPHTPTLPPPNPGAQAQMQGYSDPSGASFASPTPSYSHSSFEPYSYPYHNQPAVRGGRPPSSGLRHTVKGNEPGQSQPERTSTDSSMVQALNRA
ncbi:hypothetical protein DOTSEDRAFT_68063 [Lecanosticta acicola]|uniref:Zn(2)-C6 fungal-type domain-containing protein n=1 Tax=Lecanosticta acicola TaxID=111012 RepID=A0AAI8Z342_9PEZI|nr:hypothetical protein DOTSEDRAFT_68063 [Lecanosticta acicola]